MLTDTNFRIDTARKLIASASELRSKAMAGDGNPTTFEWADKAVFYGEAFTRTHLTGELTVGGELFCASSNALEKASAVLAGC